VGGTIVIGRMQKVSKGDEGQGGGGGIITQQSNNMKGKGGEGKDNGNCSWRGGGEGVGRGVSRGECVGGGAEEEEEEGWGGCAVHIN
jgi:hypothetical protein